MGWSEMSYNRNFLEGDFDKDMVRHKECLSKTYQLRLQKRQEMEEKRKERLKKKYKDE